MANKKVIQSASTRSTAVPSQAAFADQTPLSPHKVGLELTPCHYGAISCLVSDGTHSAVEPADPKGDLLDPGLLTQW